MAHFPSSEEILAYIEDFMEHHDAVPTRRDIAKAFHIKGPDRASLRRLLNHLEDDGVISLDGKRATIANALPPVLVLDVVKVDPEGDLLCQPMKPPEGVDVPKILLSHAAASKTKPPLGVGSRFLGRLTTATEHHLTVNPIKVLGRGATRVLGVFTPQKQGGSIQPVGRKNGDHYTIEKGDTHNAKSGELVWAEAKNQSGHGPKRARIVEIIGDVAESKNWSLIALAEQEIPIIFPQTVISEAENVPLPTLETHPDKRDLPLITIDPADAKDHDDAIYASFDDDGFTITVAIADVAWFVRLGTALDNEAERRGNSVYLVDRVVPMLPEVLSNGECSLRAGEDRAALCCEMRFDLEGHKRKHTFYRAMINCTAGISYEEAQAAADGHPNKRTTSIAEEIIDPLYRAYRLMHEAKALRPSLDLDMPERQIDLNKDGSVKGVRSKERLDAHKLVETMMVAANVCAAESLGKTNDPLIYRVHDVPKEDRLDSLRIYLSAQEYSLAKGQVVTPLSFNRILEKAAERDEMALVSLAILRTQSQAIYDTKNLGHFGLNLSQYAHFTSPIRRYADLTIHRGLIRAYNLGAGASRPDDHARLPRIAELITATERRAITAERSTTDRFLAAYLLPQMGAEFAARITGVTRAGLFAALDETGADGFIPARTIAGDSFWFDEDTNTLIGRKTGGQYRIGQRVQVLLREVTPVQGGLRYEILTDPMPAEEGFRARRSGPNSPSKHKGRGHSKGRPSANGKPKSARHAPTSSHQGSAPNPNNGQIRRKPRPPKSR